MKAKSLISCKCGKFHGSLKNIQLGTRAVCYCYDCQIYAHYLQADNKILNALGGTEVIAVRPTQITIIQGCEYLSCVSLTQHGSLRFYARCCKTPICNMSRKLHTVHISLIHCCLSHKEIEHFFDGKALHVKRNSAAGIPPKNTAVYLVISCLYYAYSVLFSYIFSGYKFNPLVNQAAKTPIVKPTILTADELSNLKVEVFEKHNRVKTRI